MCGIFHWLYEDENDYIVTIIEEEQVPLSGEVPGLFSTTPLFIASMIAMVVLALLVVITIYCVQCRTLVKRIQSLMIQSGISEKTYSAWNYKNLKEECARLEFLASEQMFHDQ